MKPEIDKDAELFFRKGRIKEGCITIYYDFSGDETICVYAKGEGVLPASHWMEENKESLPETLLRVNISKRILGQLKGRERREERSKLKKEGNLKIILYLVHPGGFSIDPQKNRLIDLKSSENYNVHSKNLRLESLIRNYINRHKNYPQ